MENILGFVQYYMMGFFVMLNIIITFWTGNKRRYFALWLIATVAMVFLLSIAFFELVMYPNKSNNLFLSIVIDILYIIVISLISFSAFKGLKITDMVYGGVSACIIQHVGYALFIIVIDTAKLADFVVNKHDIMFWILYLFFYLTTTAVFQLLQYKLKRKDVVVHRNKLILPALVMFTVVYVFNLVAVSISNDTAVELLYKFYSMFACVMIYCYMAGLFEVGKWQKEAEIIERLWRQDKKQYDIAKENIEIINEKCHDMRHQLRALRRGGEIDDKSLAEIESSINIYDSVVKTGLDALDVVLTDKSLRCRAKSIKLSCIADGELLSFMEKSDLYSLFGNALENAIEYVEKLDIEEKRFISLVIKGRDELVSVHIENYFEGEIEFIDGLPLSTKGDDNFHGFGIKSMKRIVDKYDGKMNIVVEDKLFKQNILIPKK